MIRRTVLATLILAPTAQAEVSCLFTAHEPANLRMVLDQAFDREGLYYLPKSFTGIILPDQPGASLFRRNAVVAQVVSTADAVTERQDLAVLDANGRWLLKAKLRVHGCGGALCREIEIKPRRDVGANTPLPDVDDGVDQPVPAEARSPFVMRWRFPSDAPLETYLYGERVYPGVFESALGDAVNWLTDALADTTTTMPISIDGRLNRLLFDAVQDDAMRPYFDYLVYTMISPRSVIISGYVASDELYGRAIDIVRNQGLEVADVRAIIDTRLPPATLPWPLMCGN